jgi:uncharacterized protein YerC
MRGAILLLLGLCSAIPYQYLDAEFEADIPDLEEYHSDPIWDSYYDKDDYDERIPQRQAGLSSFARSIRNGISNAGSAIVNTIRKIPTPSQAIERLADRLFGSFPRAVQQFLQQHGDKPISNLVLHRSPLPNTMQKVIEAADGNLRQQLDKYGYDRLWHVWLSFTVDGKRFGIEKNSIVRVFEGNGPQSASLPISSPSSVTMSAMLSNAIKQKGEDRILKYDPVFANCQNFLRDILSVAGILPSNAEEFFYQDAPRLLQSSTKKHGNAVAGAGIAAVGYANRFIQHVTKGRKVLAMYQDSEYSDE